MNKANVWSLADAGDEPSLRRAIKNVPSCVNVAGWSYAGGRRRGIKRGDSDSTNEDDNNHGRKNENGGGLEPWVVTSTGQVSPATILHFAVLQQSMPCVLLALEHGASADTKVQGVTADDMAEDLGEGWNDIAKVIRSTRRRQHDKVGVHQEDEERQRTVLATREENAYRHLMDGFGQGIVTVTVNMKGDGASPNSMHSIDLPRYISYNTFLAKIEALVQSRVLLSFKTPKSYKPNAVGHQQHNTSSSSSNNASAANSPEKSRGQKQAEEDEALQKDPREAAWIAEKEERENKPLFLELKPRTVGLFLQQRNPVCTARPLAFQYQAPPPASPDLGAGKTSMKSRGGVEKADTGQQTSEQNSRLQTPASRGSQRSNNTTRGRSPLRHHSGGTPSGSRVDRSTGQYVLPYNSSSGLAGKIDSVRKDSKLTPQQRLDKLMKVLSDEEEGIRVEAAFQAEAAVNARPSSSMNASGHDVSVSSAQFNASHQQQQRSVSPGQQRKKAASVPLHLDREGVDRCVERLYDRSLPKLQKRRESYENFTSESLSQLDRSSGGKKKLGELSADQSASVDRLFGGAESKQQAIAKIQERVEEAVPKPKSVALTEEELQAMGARLYGKKGPASGSSIGAKKSASSPWAQVAEKKIVSDMDSHLASIYYTAVDKKKAAIGKIEDTNGDFRARSRATVNGKKLNKTELSSMADRLSKRP